MTCDTASTWVFLDVHRHTLTFLLYTPTLSEKKTGSTWEKISLTFVNVMAGYILQPIMIKRLFKSKIYTSHNSDV